MRTSGNGPRGAAATEAREILLRNAADLKWEQMLPELGKDSPRFAILREVPKRSETTLMIEFPSALHIPRHTHEKAETHFLLAGSHTFAHDGQLFTVEAGGYFYMEGGMVHEAWAPAGAKAIIVLEDGWKVNWTEGGPSVADVGKSAPSLTGVGSSSST
jgi:quercetin dioxygenase-like cupin family protein